MQANPETPSGGTLSIVIPVYNEESTVRAIVETVQSVDLGDIDNTINLLTYQGVGAVVGFDGTALFTEDVFRSQPPDGRVTVPGFLGSIGGIGE